MRLYQFVLSCTILATALSAAVDKCAWGESYWCSSLQVAKTCGAINHCKTTIWKNEKLSQDVSEVCQFCETVITDVRTYIQDKKTQADIIRVVSSACELIPSKTTAAECKNIVNNYSAEILDLISMEIDSSVICALMGVCKGLEDSVQHAPVSPVSTLHHVSLFKVVPFHAQAEPICTDCKKFMGDLKDMITSKATEEQLEQMFDQMCSLLGSLEQQCRDMIHTFLPDILQMIAGEYDPNVICQAFGFCTATNPKAKTLLVTVRLQRSDMYRAQVATSNTVNSAETCLVCKTVMSELQNIDRDKAVQAEIETFVKTELCSRLGSMKSTCEEMVQLYGPELFELLANELDPDTRCRSLGFCQAQSVVRVNSPSVQCVLCEFIMRELDQILEDNATQAEIMAALDKVCSILPSGLKDSCLDFINTYGPAIIELLEQELTPSEVCSVLGLCQSKQHVLTVRVHADPETCLICETVVQYLDALLDNNATVAEIEAMMTKICNFLPDTMKIQCTDLIKTYGALIIKYITTEASPRQVCVLAGACSNTAVQSSPMMSLVPAKPLDSKVVAMKAPLLGVNECTYGPAFWCASKENAQKCKTTEHCVKYVWKN